MAPKKKTFTFQPRPNGREALDRLRQREPFPHPSQGEMINRLIERADVALDRLAVAREPISAEDVEARFKEAASGTSAASGKGVTDAALKAIGVDQAIERISKILTMESSVSSALR
jgi:hypothetical protein